MSPKKRSSDSPDARDNNPKQVAPKKTRAPRTAKTKEASEQQLKPTTDRKPRAPRKRAAPLRTLAHPEAPRSTPEHPQALLAPSAPLRIVMVSSEAHPFAKTGGLAEVLGALPLALSRLGHDVTVVLPRYRGVSTDSATRVPHAFMLDGNRVEVDFAEIALEEGVKAVLVDAPKLFDRDSLYGSEGRDYPDNAWRFAVLSRGALEYVRVKGRRPSVLHAHDWQAGLVPVFQKTLFTDDPVVGRVPCVFTIHNLAFQGVFSPQVLPTLGLGPEMLNVEAMEYWGQVSYLKGGVNFSEKLTTVSPTYAREVLTPEYGFGMEGVLRRRQDDFIGILNGIDTTRWNPEADELVPAHFTAENLAGKREAKRALLRTVGLPTDDAALERPVIGVISRLTDQKGFDLIGAAAGDLMSLDAAWTMLGSGEPHYENLWRAMAARHPDRVSASIGFDERQAHLIEAGADIFLMPSRYEPCGLNQLYSLRYGTLPVVRATGGLDDTVVDAAEPDGNGFKFSDYTPGALVAAVRRALAAYQDPDVWSRLQRAGMARDSSWDVSAREYVKVYKGLVRGH